METESNKTLHDRVVSTLRNSYFIVVVLIVFTTIGGIGQFTGALDTTWSFIQLRLLGRSTEIRNEYCQLLRPLIVELDRTKAAFERWNAHDLSLESETIRDGNLRARALLREKAHLVPDALREDQRKLIVHYDQWLEEYDRVRVRRSTKPDEPFVFVYSFPTESEALFRTRMADVEKLLGEKPRCQ
jgi:hypothetical protein